MGFRFYEMPLSGKNRVSEMSKPERSYADQHLWEQSLAFLYPVFLSEDTSRPERNKDLKGLLLQPTAPPPFYERAGGVG